MTQVEQTSDTARRATVGEKATTAALVEAQIKIARGLVTLGLITGAAIGLGVPLTVLNLAPIGERMHWVLVCCAVVAGSGIIIASMVAVIVGYLRTSRCLGELLERA